MQIDIIGGGYAGCAAALTLMEQGHSIRLWESRAEPGGRARRIDSRLSGVLSGTMERPFDNGQHLIAGAYHTLIELVERVYGSHPIPWRRMPLALFEGNQLQPWFKPVGCVAPLSVLIGLLRSDLSWKNVCRLFSLLSVLKSACFLDRYPTVSGLKSVHPELYRRLIEPLCLAILNTPADKACVRRFLSILELVFQRTSDSDAIFVETDLTTLFPEKVVELLRSRGHDIHLASRVKRLSFGEDGRWILDTPNGSVRSDAVILAVAPDQLSSLLKEIPQTQECLSIQSWVASLSYSPISTIYFQSSCLPFLSYPMVQLDSQPGQWLFDRDWGREVDGSIHHCCRNYAIVISAAYEWLSLSLEARQHVLLEQLGRIFSVQPQDIQKIYVVNEKRATYCIEPNLLFPSKMALGYRLYVAGDYTDPILPATLEAAVKSGVNVAKALLMG